MTVGLIPARYHATRFPGKLLAPLGSKTVIEHVLENAVRARRVDRVVVVTDDARIADVVTAAGGDVFRSRGDHPTGSDRIGEAVEALGLDGTVVNIQGDEPLLSADAIDDCVAALHGDESAGVATLATACPDEEADDPSVVKVVRRRDGRALYFSRRRIPFGSGSLLKHIGIYAYRVDVLRRFVAMPPGRLEASERLEQLRLLEAGVELQVAVGSYVSVGIDTPKDLAVAARALGIEDAQVENAS